MFTCLLLEFLLHFHYIISTIFNKKIQPTHARDLRYLSTEREQLILMLRLYNYVNHNTCNDSFFSNTYIVIIYSTTTFTYVCMYVFPCPRGRRTTLAINMVCMSCISLLCMYVLLLLLEGPLQPIRWPNLEKSSHIIAPIAFTKPPSIRQ